MIVEAALAIVIVLLGVVAVLQFLVLRRARPDPVDLAPVLSRIEIEESGLRDELARSREELNKRLGDELGRSRAELNQRLEQELGRNRAELNTRLTDELGRNREDLNKRLEQVHLGLGEMKALASGVGDLKRVLTNVRVRGTWGEVQVRMLLQQMLTPDQYAENVATTGTSERVEFAIRLPGNDDGEAVWLPIDAKFPQEDYIRLMQASEQSDAATVDACARQLELRVRQCARDIASKYIAPPATTDFGIMYLATEGLYAEVLRRPGLMESLQHDYRVTVAGPTTLTALLNSLQMGFRTLAIQRRSGEVWKLLGEVKTEFQKYSDALLKVQKKLQEANNAAEAGLTRTRVIQRRLKDVQALPAPEAEAADAASVDA